MVIMLIVKSDQTAHNMKKFLIITSIFLFCQSVQAQTSGDTLKNKNNDFQLVEASCGECNFHMHGKSCDLAIRIDGKTYFVDGAKIDDFGNAHAVDGFCSTIRHAYVKGVVVNDRFKAEYFKLVASPDTLKETK